MSSISNGFSDCQVVGLGVESADESHYSRLNYGFSISNIILVTKSFKLLPLFLKHILVYLELNIKFYYYLLKSKPKILHVNDFHLLLVAYFYSFGNRTYIVYDAHELESETNGLKPVYSKVIKTLERISWKRIDLLITPSESINNWYINKFGFKFNVTILNTPIIHRSENYFDDNYLRTKFSIKDDEKIFIYVGILGPGRGIEKYLEIFKNENIRSHIVFLGYGPLRGLIEDVVSTNDNVHFHPPVSHELVTEIVQHADIGLALIENISLSDYLCAPNKLFEYAFSNVYVLASDFPEMRRLIDNYNLGDIVNPDTDSLFMKIKEIEEKSSINIESRNIHELSWDFQSRILVEAYEKMIKS